MKIVLASSSRYRKELLARLGFPFETMAPEVDETPRPGEMPQDLVLRLAKAKAASAARSSGPAIVIASDQVAAAGERTLGKPGTREDAIANLMSMAGTAVTFVSEWDIEFFDAIREHVGGENLEEIHLAMYAQPARGGGATSTA